MKVERTVVEDNEFVVVTYPSGDRYYHGIPGTIFTIETRWEKAPSLNNHYHVHNWVHVVKDKGLLEVFIDEINKFKSTGVTDFKNARYFMIRMGDVTKGEVDYYPLPIVYLGSYERREMALAMGSPHLSDESIELMRKQVEMELGLS